MEIMLVAATPLEIAPALEWLQKNEFRTKSGTAVNVVITGIGSMQTTYRLMDAIHRHRPDALIQAGIAGSFSLTCPPGSLTIVQEESIGDLGVEENGLFRDIFDMQLQQPGELPFTDKALLNPNTSIWAHLGLPFVKAVTINEITTSPQRIRMLQQNYSAIVESMEGAAFHYVALQQKLPFLQLRAVSNMVGERNKKNWLMKESIAILNQQLIHILQEAELFENNN